MEGKDDGGKDGRRRSVNDTVRFCFAPLAVSRLLVFHALLQRRFLLGPVYSLLAPSSLSLFLHQHAREASVYNASRVCFTASLTHKHGSSSHQLRLFTDLYVSFNEGSEGGTGPKHVASREELIWISTLPVL